MTMAEVPESCQYPAELIHQLNEIKETVSDLTGSLCDSDKKRKRWIIIGIVLHLSISPVLRKYIAKRIGQLYETLKRNNNIDTQQHPFQLPCYQTTFLNYEAINNNQNNWPRQKNRYDYCVKNPVDLSKLFLPTHMAHYSAIDEGCDLSALLGIIIGTSPHAEASARQVRSEVRNPWAHCNFSKWDEAKYTESFSLIDSLVRRLGMNKQEENDIFTQLYRLNRNGKMFIEGKSSEIVVLAEIETQLQAMVKCIKQSIQIREEMTASIKRIETRMVEQEGSVPKHMKEKFQICIEMWKKDDQTFSVTRATKSVSKLIKTNNVVTVVGSSGSGKSSIIHHVALQFESVQKFEVITFVSSPVDIIQYRDMKKDQLFIIDDFCGKNYIDETDLQAWKKHSEIIEKLFPIEPNTKQGQLKFLVSCRLQIFKDDKFKNLDLFTKKAIDLQAKDYCLLNDEKLTMIGMYITNTMSDYKWQKINEKLEGCHFFPLLCKIAKGKNVHQLEDLFSSPIDCMRKDIKDMIQTKPMENCALVLCVLFPDGFREDFINPKKRSQEVQQKITDIFNNFKEVTLDNERERIKFRKTLERLDGTYVKKIGPSYSISHDKLYDLIGVECCHELHELFIENAPGKFIADNFRFKSYYGDQEEDDSFIYLPVYMEGYYFERLFKDLRQNTWQTLFNNRLVTNNKFKADVMTYIHQNEESCKKLFLKLDEDGMEERHGWYTYTTTPVIEATKTGFYELVVYLINIKCDNSKQDRFGNSPLYYSCKNSFVNILEFLLSKGVNPIDDLVYACWDGLTNGVRMMIDRRVNLSVHHSVLGRTPLIAACDRGHSDIVRMLLDGGADPLQFEGDKDGMTPLMHACRRGHIRIVAMLLDAGADPLQRDKRGKTVLDNFINDTTIRNLLKSHIKQ